MKISRLTFWLKDLVAEIIEVDGYLFIDRKAVGIPGLRQSISTYASVSEAQSWINIIPLSEFISEFVGDDWEIDDPDVSDFLTVIELAWKFQIKAKYPNVPFKIERWLDHEYGDVGLKMTSEMAPTAKSA